MKCARRSWKLIAWTRCRVFEWVLFDFCKVRMQKESIKVRWVDTLKSSGTQRNKQRAKGFRRGSNYEGFVNFSATPLEFVKLIILLATDGSQRCRGGGANVQSSPQCTPTSAVHMFMFCARRRKTWLRSPVPHVCVHSIPKNVGSVLSCTETTSCLETATSQPEWLEKGMDAEQSDFMEKFGDQVWAGHETLSKNWWDTEFASFKKHCLHQWWRWWRTTRRKCKEEHVHGNHFKKARHSGVNIWMSRKLECTEVSWTGSTIGQFTGQIYSTL